MLIKVIDYVTAALEDSRAAVIYVLSAVDFSKVFNRLEYCSYIKTIAEHWASSDVLQLLATFLMGQTMTVTVGSCWSNPKLVIAGAPRESLLGCYFFNLGVDDLEKGYQSLAIRTSINGVNYKKSCAEKNNGLLEHIHRKAEAKGMRVNEKKTRLMCVFAARIFNPRVQVTFNGQLIKGQDNLRIRAIRAKSELERLWK